MKSTSLLILLFATLLMSFKGIFVKLLYQEGLSTDIILSYRYLFSSIILCFFVLVSPKRRSSLARLPKRDLLLIALLAFLGYYLASGLDFLAIQIMGVGISRALLFIYPIFVVIISAVIARKWPRKERIISAITAQVGLILVFSSIIKTDNISIFSIFLSIGAALSYATYMVILGRKKLSIDSITLVGIIVSFAFLFSTGASFARHGLADYSISKLALVWTLALALVSTVIPIVLIVEAIKKAGSATTAIITAMGPIFSLFTAYFIFQETYSLLELLGTGIIISAVVYLNNAANKQS